MNKNLTLEEKAIVNEIESFRKGAFKGLNNSLGIEFGRVDFSIHAIMGTTTLKNLVKTYAITDDELAILLVKIHDWNDKNNFKVIVFNSQGQFNTDIKTYWQNAIDGYYRKSDFETARKQADFQGYVIITNKENFKCSFDDLDSKNYNRFFYFNKQKEELQRKIYNSCNVRLVNARDEEKQGSNVKERCNGRGKSTVYGFWNIRPIDNNLIFDFEVDVHNIMYGDTEPLTEYDIIDKSGYNVYCKRAELKRQANKIRAERKLNEAKNMDYREQNETIRKMLLDTKNSLIVALSNSEIASDTYEAVVDNLKRLGYAQDDFNKHLERLQDMYNSENNSWYSYNDVETITKNINNIMDKVKKLAM